MKLQYIEQLVPEGRQFKIGKNRFVTLPGPYVLKVLPPANIFQWAKFKRRDNARGKRFLARAEKKRTRAAAVADRPYEAKNLSGMLKHGTIGRIGAKLKNFFSARKV